MQYCSLQHHQSHPQLGVVFTLAHPFILSGVISPIISSSILGTYRPGEFIFQCPIFLPFHTVHGVLKARTLKWFAIPFSSGPYSVRPLHHDPSVLGGPTRHGLVSLSQISCGPCDQIGQVSVIVVKYFFNFQENGVNVLSLFLLLSSANLPIPPNLDIIHFQKPMKKSRERGKPGCLEIREVEGQYGIWYSLPVCQQAFLCF